jgi:hypothetical protein
MRLGLVIVSLALLSTRIDAPGGMKGRIVDSHGGVLPGVNVLAVSVPGVEAQAVTDSTGSYELRDLPAGKYSLRARLNGFSDSTREDVNVSHGDTTGQVDLVLCPVIEEIDWPKTTVGGLWALADVVVHLRISATARRLTGCAEEDVEHTGLVIEVFKANGKLAVGRRLAFAQENWRGERTPYQVGQEMVVFLTATPLGYRRAAGPQSAFPVNGRENSDILEAVRKLAKESGRK